MNGKILKRVGVSVLALGSMFALAGCGSKSSSSSSSDSKVLKVSVDPSYKSYINDIKGKFEKDNHVTLQVSYKPMLDEDTALALDGPAGKGPDVLMAPYDRVGGLAQQNQISKVTLPSGRYNSLGEKTVKYNNKIYGAPVTIESLIMYYNKDLIKKAPTSFNELEKISKDSKYAYSNDKSKNVGFLTQFTNFYNSYGVFKGYGGDVFGDNNTNPKKLLLNNKGSVDALKMIGNYYQNIWPKGTQNVTSSENFIMSQFTSGKTAVILDGPWVAKTLSQTKSLHYGSAELPLLPNGKRYQAFGGGKAWVVSNYSKNKSVAQKWLDYVSNTANQNKFYNVTQEIPANMAARKEAVDSGDALAKAVNDQFKYDVPLINLPEMAEVWNPAQTIVTNVASGMSPQKAADNGVKIIQQNIKQKYPKDK